MTRFFLHGGGSKSWSEDQRRENYQQTAKIVTNGLNAPIKVLLVCFARTPDSWQEKLASVKEDFSKALDVENEVILANEQPKIFVEQISRCDIIYVVGGDTKLLLKFIQHIPDFENLINGKIYFGSSAGAYLVSRYYFSNDRRQVEDGLDLLPIKCFAHWDVSQLEALNDLKKHEQVLPTLLLKEGDLVSIEI